MKSRLYLRFPGFKDKAVTFSFDDGVIDDLKTIEIFKRLNLKGTFNLNSGLMNVDTKIKFEDIDKVYDGFEIASHGLNHRFLEEVDTAAAVLDIIKDRENLENKLNRIVKGFAYPYGSAGPQSINALKACGMLYGRGVVSSHNFNLPEDFLLFNPTSHYADDDVINLAHKFVDEYNKNNKHCPPGLFYIWGHSYEFDMRNDYDRFVELCEILANKDDIYYATNAEIFEYIKAYDNLEFSHNQKIVHNPSALTIYIHIYSTDIKVKPNETVVIDK